MPTEARLALIDPSLKAAAISALAKAPTGSRRAALRIESQGIGYALLGEFDRAFAAMDQAARERTFFAGDFLGPRANPQLIRLRSHPRFGDTMRKAGLIDYWRANGWPDVCGEVDGKFVCDRPDVIKGASR